MAGEFLLGVWVVSPGLNTITCDGDSAHLEPKVMDVLVCLAQSAGETVSKEQLLEKIWPDTFVTDDVLKRAICELRRALGDDAHAPLIIETIPRRGYRLVVKPQPVDKPQVKYLPPHLGDSPEIASRGGLLSTGTGRRTIASLVDTITEYRRARWAWMIAAGVLALLGVSLALALLAVLNVRGFGNRVLGMSRTPSIHSIAVMPLQNLSADPSQEYFSDGLTDALITDLAQIGSLQVISRTSTMAYKNSTKSLPQIAKELNVDAIVEGTIQRSNDRVRISAQLIDASSDQHLWAASYDREIQDTFSLESEIARSVAQQVRVNLTSHEEQLLTRTQPVNLKAIEPYLRGRYHYQSSRALMDSGDKQKGREVEARLAIRDFQNAIAEDPNYAPAYVALARTYVERGLLSASENRTARENIEKALAIDPTLAEAHMVLGRLNLFDWQWKATRSEYLRAIELNPNLAEAHNYYAEYLNISGRFDQGLREAELAKSLDPGSDRLAWQYYLQRQFDRFIELKRNDVESHILGPMTRYELGYGYERAHKYPEAIQEWVEATTGFGFDEQAEALRRNYALKGFKAAIEAWAACLEKVAANGGTVYPEEPAYLYAILGNKTRAFAWLEKGYQQKTHGMPFLMVDPTWDDIRSDPRFADLERRVGLPP